MQISAGALQRVEVLTISVMSGVEALPGRQRRGGHCLVAAASPELHWQCLWLGWR